MIAVVKVARDDLGIIRTISHFAGANCAFARS